MIHPVLATVEEMIDQLTANPGFAPKLNWYIGLRAAQVLCHCGYLHRSIVENGKLVTIVQLLPEVTSTRALANLKLARDIIKLLD